MKLPLAFGLLLLGHGLVFCCGFIVRNELGYLIMGLPMTGIGALLIQYVWDTRNDKED